MSHTSRLLADTLARGAAAGILAMPAADGQQQHAV